MKLMHKTFLNKGECQHDLTIENGIFFQDRTH